ncbi:hypothetical protein FACS1894190_14880 [Spirochaetia bacterium]|nr:hypothetical protein FACS1894190_14880 [Spirochaetia bacterium]
MLKNKLRIISKAKLLLALLAIAVFFGCEQPATTLSPPPASSSATAPLRVELVSSSTNGEPKIIFAVTNGDENTYAIDVCVAIGPFVAETTQRINYNGIGERTLGVEEFSEKTIAKTLTESTGEGIVITATDGTTHEEGGSRGEDRELPHFEGFNVSGEAFDFGIGFGLQGTVEDVITKNSTTSWSSSITKAITASLGKERSVETSFSTAITTGESRSAGAMIGKIGDPHGLYRMALYATADVYLVIKTSRDNQTLLYYEFVICARDKGYFVNLDYVPFGEDFDNSPVGEKIAISSDFYKNLTAPVFDPSAIATATSVTVTPVSASVEPGKTQQFTAVVNGANNPLQMVTWSVSGNKASGTIIAGGLLTIDPNETATSLTVTATSIIDKTLSSTASVTVTGSQYTVTYNANDASGTTPALQTVNAGSSITLAGKGDLSKTDYIFCGWSEMNYKPGSSYKPVGDTTLYAQWVKAKQTIEFNVGNPRVPDDWYRTNWASITLDLAKLKNFGECQTVSFEWKTYWAENEGSLDCRARVVLDCADRNLYRQDWSYFNEVINPGAGWKWAKWDFSSPIDIVADRPNIRCAYGYEKHEKSYFFGIETGSSYYDLSGIVSVTVTVQPPK